MMPPSPCWTTSPRSTSAPGRSASCCEPEVGIFFVYDGKPLIEGTPVSEGEAYGRFKVHATGHPAFWHTLQRNGMVPTDVEYDEVPRGRVGYQTQERKFYVFADACIKKDSHMMDHIERDMKLPSASTAPPKLDSHYRCPGCMKSKNRREQKERTGISNSPVSLQSTQMSCGDQVRGTVDQPKPDLLPFISQAYHITVEELVER